MDRLSPDQLTVLREGLLSSQAELTRLLEDSSGLADTVVLDQAAVGRISRVDALQQQAMAKAALRRHEMRLQRVESALERFAEDPDEFGFCPDCAELIPWKRISRFPESIFCVECAEARGR